MNSDSKRSAMPEDWNKDSFPTSARPIYRAVLLLCLLVGALCFAVYYSSEHPEDAAKESKREKIKTEFLGEEQDLAE